MAFTYTETTCGTWCRDNADYLRGSNTCANASMMCKEPRPFMSALVDVADHCSERCIKRVRSVEWEPSLWDEVAAETGDIVYKAKKAGRQIGMSLTDWKTLRAKYDAARVRLQLILKMRGLPAATRRKAEALVPKVAAVDKAIRNSGLEGFQGMRGYSGGGLLGLRSHGVGEVAISTIVAISIVGTTVIVVGWVAHKIAEVVTGVAAIDICMDKAADVPAEERAAFVERCAGAGGGWRNVLILGGMSAVGLAVAWFGYRQYRRYQKRD